jgi:hypothetical protein
MAYPPGQPEICFTGLHLDRAVTRNDVTDAELIIDSGLQTIAGPKQPVRQLAGRFRGKTIRLGDIRTDSQNRLIVCGGFGVSEALPPQALTTDLHFADNDGWYDVTADSSIEVNV